MFKSNSFRSIIYFSQLASCLILVVGCENRSQDDALLGGAFGAAAGAIIGGGRAEGLVLGAGLGALAGGITGSAADTRRKPTVALVPAGNPLTIEQIVQLSRAHTPADSILRIMRSRGGIYSAYDIQILAAYPEVQASILDYLRSCL